MEEPPSLKLVILQGPREGETLDFKPGSAIRIGRVIRGNTLPIKDPGISSKHLSILTESGKWVLRDLDSSNGTVFNGSKIPPHTPFDLQDGSTIKIGELTSILVTFQNANQNGLNPNRTGQTEPSLENEGSIAPVPKPVRGRRRKVQIQTIEENENASVNDSGFVGRPARMRVTRNLKSKGNVLEGSDLKIGNLDAPEEKVEEPKNTRVTRNSKKKPAVIEISDSSIGNSGAPEEKVEDQIKLTRVTRNSSVIVDDPQSLSFQCGVENVEKKKTRGGGRRKKKLVEECRVVDGDDLDKELKNDEGEKENLNGNVNGPNLENLSLGEWFDFLEVHLPKQIIDSTEEMFDSMRQKAERLREYIMMQKNQKVEMHAEQ